LLGVFGHRHILGHGRHSWLGHDGHRRCHGCAFVLDRRRCGIGQFFW
jgi:hypothetical protein